MTQEELARLFTGGASGIGLGLRLVRSIAELHGGAFVIEGREGRGASARVMLPADILLIVKVRSSYVAMGTLRMLVFFRFIR